MIQRIQSLYLLIASVITATLFRIPVLSIISNDRNYVIFYNGMKDYMTHETVSTNPAGLLILVFAVIVPLIAIFIFKKRVLQMKFVNYSIMFNVLFIVDMVYYLYRIKQSVDFSVEFQLGIVLPFVSIILLYLAKRNIKKDEELIRSVDRIR